MIGRDRIEMAMAVWRQKRGLNRERSQPNEMGPASCQEERAHGAGASAALKIPNPKTSNLHA